VAAREDFEFRRLQFQHHSSCNPAFLAGRGPGQFGKPADHRLGLGERYVTFKRIFRRNGLRRPVGYNVALVDTAGQFVETNSVASEAALEHGQVEAPQVRNCLHVEALELFFRDFSDSRQTAHRQRQ